MKFLILFISAFSLNTLANVPGCQEYSGTYYCVSTEDNGIQPENKTFTLQNGVLIMKANPFEVKPQTFPLDGKTYVTKDGQGEEMDTVASCSGSDTTVTQSVPKMTYQRQYLIHYASSVRLFFTDITTTQNTDSYNYSWNCLQK